MKKALIIGLFAVVGILNTSCEDEEICLAIHLADLVLEKLSIAVPTVQVGVAFKISTIVKNIAKGTNFCETKSAPESDTEYTAEYRADANSPWESIEIENQSGQSVMAVYAPVGKVSAGSTSGYESSFMMETPGFYRFLGKADGRLAVEERNENNNLNTSNGGSLNRSAEAVNAEYVVIEVLPSEDDTDDIEKEKKNARVYYLGSQKLW